ncbi:hypothetical protein PYCCODRAFT_222003 [Trametes coccinea BRFM310]|uniref:Uncharacterized protein n=1 Tax=Trametes coccinea (strain BRFM310) TaxID=1353009 RepID=A0A1Y2IQU9_TRAC3|nr:hypothetical protein PYCCODRAFT_222003 [Trametes coccinea BRFM310]
MYPFPYARDNRHATMFQAYNLYIRVLDLFRLLSRHDLQVSLILSHWDMRERPLHTTRNSRTNCLGPRAGIIGIFCRISYFGPRPLLSVRIWAPFEHQLNAIADVDGQLRWLIAQSILAFRRRALSWSHPGTLTVVLTDPIATSPDLTQAARLVPWPSV